MAQAKEIRMKTYYVTVVVNNIYKTSSFDSASPKLALAAILAILEAYGNGAALMSIQVAQP